MVAVSHGVRQLRQGIGVPRRVPVPARSIHVLPRFSPSAAQRILSETRALVSRLVSCFSHSLAAPSRPSSVHLTQFTNSQSINARFSLPVRHALSRPFSPPRLPRPPVVPANVTQVGLDMARAFHSGRPIFQNMVDNVPIATRALWEAEWDVKMKKKEARRMRRATQNKTIPKSQQMLQPKPKPVVADPRCDSSELDIYFPVKPTPAVTTHLLVPLAPTPTARFPLSRADGGGAHPLLPISHLASIHTRHQLHSLRVSSLFARLDSANVWDDPGVNVDAYAFGPRHDAQEKQCTVLRVTFKGWHTRRVRAILGDSAEEWYSLEETHLDGRPTFVPVPDLRQDMRTSACPETPSLESFELESSWASERGTDDVYAVLSPPPMRASASAQHELVLPTLDFSSTVSGTVHNIQLSPQPMIFLRAASELTCDPRPVLPSSSASTVLSPALPVGSWDCPTLSSSFLERVEEHGRDGAAVDI